MNTDKKQPERIHVLGLGREELRERLAELGLAAYRGDQVRQWVFERRADSFEAMTNLSKLDRTRLAERFVVAAGQVADHQQATDGVHKLLIRWPDAAACETVLIPAAPSTALRAGGRATACLSTQVGCPVGCRFCASGLGGLVRNLTAGEIVEQAWRLARDTLAPDERISNIVFMGIGEPLANYAAVVQAVRLLNAADGLNIGARKITISTVGLPSQIRKLADEGLQVTLAISLHAPSQGLREQLIPWAAKIPLNEIVAAAGDYFAKTGREVTFEYLLLEGVNSSAEQADQLARIARSIRSNVNLIRYNPVAELGYDRPTAATVRAFRDRLASHGVNAHVRPSRGLTIDAACGQLRRRAEAAGNGQPSEEDI